MPSATGSSPACGTNRQSPTQLRNYRNIEAHVFFNTRDMERLLCGDRAGSRDALGIFDRDLVLLHPVSPYPRKAVDVAQKHLQLSLGPHGHPRPRRLACGQARRTRGPSHQGWVGDDKAIGDGSYQDGATVTAICARGDLRRR